MGAEMAHDALEMVEYRDRPAVHLFGDTRSALDRMRRTATSADCRILGAIMIKPDSGAFRDCATGAAALIELDGAVDGEEIVPLLDWAQSQAEAGVRRSVISAPPTLIDLVAARTPHGDVIHLCDAADRDRVAAVARASRPRALRLNDIGRDDGPLILQQLSEDVGRIAAILASLSEDEAQTMAAIKPAGDQEADRPGVDAASIRAMIRARRLRDQFFRGDLFADPAWDMLLDLMAARLEKNRVAVSSLCIAAAVPATTALRWIKALTDRGLLVRQADPQDGRRVYIELSDDAARALAAYLRAVKRMSATTV